MRSLPLAVAAFAFFAPRARTQQDPTQPTLKVYSRETVVDVIVTDSKGNSVHGLTRADFTVKEDGKPQSIRSFQEFSFPSASQPLPNLPSNVHTNLQPPPAGPLNVALLDFFNISALPGIAVTGSEDAESRAVAAQNAIKQAAKKYFEFMPPGTRIIVLGLSNNLRTLQGATSAPLLLSAAVDTLQYNEQGRADTYNAFCAAAEQRSRVTIEVLNQIATDLSTVKGKKNLVWFSIGIPWLTDPDAHPKCLPDYDLYKTYGLLQAAQIAIYPIDVRGVPTMPNAFITSIGRLWQDIPNLSGAAQAQARSDFLQTIAEQQLSMESIAEATGGAAFYNSNDLANLMTKAIASGSDYYTLSYAPPGLKYNYAHHRIKIEVDKPGLHLVYRQSYDAIDPATIKPAPGLTFAAIPSGAGGPHPDAEAAMHLAMGRAMPASTDLLFDLQVEPSTEPAKPTDPPVFGHLDPKLNSRPLTRYGFTYGIPGKQIAFATSASNTRRGALEFDIAAYDGDAKLLTSLSQTINLPLTSDQAGQLARSPFRFFQQLDLPSDALFLRIGVLDHTSGKIGTIEIPLAVPKK